MMRYGVNDDNEASKWRPPNEELSIIPIWWHHIQDDVKFQFKYLITLLALFGQRMGYKIHKDWATGGLMADIVRPTP